MEAGEGVERSRRESKDLLQNRLGLLSDGVQEQLCFLLLAFFFSFDAMPTTVLEGVRKALHRERLELETNDSNITPNTENLSEKHTDGFEILCCSQLLNTVGSRFRPVFSDSDFGLARIAKESICEPTATRTLQAVSDVQFSTVSVCLANVYPWCSGKVGSVQGANTHNDRPRRQKTAARKQEKRQTPAIRKKKTPLRSEIKHQTGANKHLLMEVARQRDRLQSCGGCGCSNCVLRGVRKRCNAAARNFAATRNVAYRSGAARRGGNSCGSSCGGKDKLAAVVICAAGAEWWERGGHGQRDAATTFWNANESELEAKLITVEAQLASLTRHVVDPGTAGLVTVKGVERDAFRNVLQGMRPLQVGRAKRRDNLPCSRELMSLKVAAVNEGEARKEPPYKRSCGTRDQDSRRGRQFTEL